MNESFQPVIVTDLRIPFFRLMMFFVKATLAAIPAAIIVGFVVMLVTMILAVALGDNSFVIRRWTY